MVLYFIYSCLTTAIASLGLGLIVFLHNKKIETNRSWFYLSITVFLWSFGYYKALTSNSLGEAAFWNRISYLGSIFIPATYYHFISVLTDSIDKKKIKIFYLCSSIFVLFLPTNLIIASAKSSAGFKYFTQPGKLYPFLAIYFISLAFYAIFKLLKTINKTTGYKKHRLFYVAISSIIGFTGGTQNFMTVMGYSVFPYGNFLVISYNFLVAYAILRYRLMDIEVIIRETAVFAGIFGFAVGAFTLLMYAGQTILEPYLKGHPLLYPAVALFLVTIAVRPIERLVYNTVGKLLFKKRRKYQKALKDAAEGMATIRKPERLLGLITHVASKNLRPTNVAVYVYDDERYVYSLRSAKYPSKIDKTIEFSSDEPLISSLKQNKLPIVTEEVEHWLREEQARPHREVLTSDLEKIKNKLSSLGASVCIPSFFHEDELLGLLVLGDKKSGDLYTNDDLELLNSLADEAAVAIRNSTLYRKLQQKAEEVSVMYQKEQTMFAHAASAFANAIDARDPYTHGHSQRVTDYSLALADQMEEARFGSEEKHRWFKRRLQLAGLLHDIGKIAVPDRILQKAGPLNEEEWKEMKKHPVIGANVLSHVRGLWDIVPAVRHHHERYDGKGYPDGLAQEDVPFMARIMAAADTFDAMTSDRPYRKALTAEASKQEINNNSATQFDPYVVGIFMKAYAKSLITKIMEQNR